MSTLTTNFSLIKPGVADPTDEDLWGGYLNDDLDDIDTELYIRRDSPAINKTANYTVVVGDRGKLITCDANSAGFTLSLPAAATAGNGFNIRVLKTDSTTNAVTIDPDGAETINGSANLVVDVQYETVIISCDGTTWHVIATNIINAPVLLNVLRPYSTTTASTSGTAVSFLSIPAGTRRIVITLDGVSTNGTSRTIVQIGDSGGLETSGYSGVVGTNGATAAMSSGFSFVEGVLAAITYGGVVSLFRADTSTNTWVAQAHVFASSLGDVNRAVGVKSLSAELDRVAITTEGGVNTFDAGKITVEAYPF